MRKLWFVGIFIVIISLALIGCSEDSNGDNSNNNKNEDVNEEENEANNEEDNTNENENELNQEENDDNNMAFGNDDENNNEEGFGEESIADEMKPLNVEEVLVDEEKETKYKEGRDTFIEHDELVYVEHNFITHLLDYELTYDEENTFAELFKEKGDFNYKPAHEDEGGAIMDIGQIYVEETDEYEDIPGDSADLYKFIEYEGKLYVPARLINVFMESPLNFERRDQTMEVGLHADATNIFEMDVDNDYSSSSVEVTKDASDVTIEGENFEQGIILNNINSAEKSAGILTDYNYSEISGFIYNKSDEDDIEIKIQYRDDKTIETIDLEPGETQEFKQDVKGKEVIRISATGVGGSSGKAVIVGELK